MPQLADITVKKNDGTTDIVYVGTVPSSGEQNPAIFRATAGAASPALAPELRIVARDQDQGRKRAVRTTYVYPQAVTNSSTGVTSVANRALAVIDWNFPKEMSQAAIDEAASQLAGLINSTLVKSCLKTGYSAT